MGSTAKKVDTLLTSSLKLRIRSQQPQARAKAAAQMKQQAAQDNGHVSVFARNLQEALDQRSEAGFLRLFAPNEFDGETPDPPMVDFSSNNILSWNESSLLRDEFFAQLATNPKFTVGSGGTRLMDGNYSYLEDLEREISEFHGAEAGLITNSGYDANVAVWGAIPRPGDIMVHDSLVHSSTHEGMSRSLAVTKIEFRHSDLDHYRKVLAGILEEFPLVRQGKRTVLVAIEGVYSMDGDVAPLREFVDIADEMFKHKNVEFVMDEAHSSGLFGPGGAGLVSELGLEKRIAVRVHTFGKSVGASGAIVLGSHAIKSALINFNPAIIFSTAPPFPMVAAIKAGYNLIRSEKGQEARDKLQHVARLLFSELTSHPSWPLALETGLLNVPLTGEDSHPDAIPCEWWENRSFYTHIVTLHTRPQYLYWLYLAILEAGFRVWVVEYPIVPLGKPRIKISLHAGNTDEQVVGLVSAIFGWVEEIHALEQKSGSPKDVEPTSAAKKVFEWMRSEGLVGFGV